ncbi:hypothetical protein Salat_2141700 [Sesamum alatum]|uniref:Reverse transcriptase zinc-binding domain-containing protein n=1 Tax=Sesamum alatum TaxID=300844 RepID=A0AAE2CH60_9LAMI|nr:hypothetical protein Salat_2141700 [Sesamum alatum]
MFYVRSAYSLLLESKAHRRTSSTRLFFPYDDPRKLWRCLWSAPVPHRVKVLAWRIYRGAIATQDTLARHSRDVDTRCVICDVEVESMRHVFPGLSFWSGSMRCFSSAAANGVGVGGQCSRVDV